MTVQFDYHVNNPVENAIIGVKINRIDGVYVYGTDTRIDKFKNFEITQMELSALHLRICRLLRTVLS